MDQRNAAVWEWFSVFTQQLHRGSARLYCNLYGAVKSAGVDESVLRRVDSSGGHYRGQATVGERYQPIRNSRFSTLPTELRGSAVTHSTALTHLYPAN